MLVLPNMTMKLLNVRKNKETTKYDKSRDTYIVSTVQCNVRTIKCNVLVT